jgi:RNA polymerase sigma-70 factor, ECF subfamily
MEALDGYTSAARRRTSRFLARVSVLPAVDTSRPDAESREWLRDLRADGAAHDDAVDRLHALLFHAARFEAARRRGYLPHLHDQLEEIAREAADDALVSVLARLEEFRGESRFTTWAYKFALVETAVKLRKRDWQRRELPLEPDTWKLLATQTGIDDVLTEHERRVLVAVALSGVPIDVLADRLDSTRGAVYQTLHDARIKLRAHLAACGLRVSVR